jgi:hypothetical protein
MIFPNQRKDPAFPVLLDCSTSMNAVSTPESQEWNLWPAGQCIIWLLGSASCDTIFLSLYSGVVGLSFSDSSNGNLRSQ